MNTKPILFSGPMVRALLEGRKSQTRRVLKTQPHAGLRDSVFVASGVEDGHGREIKIPYYPGDLLWVRESFSFYDAAKTKPQYQADLNGKHKRGGWKPSIHMPRWASRITLSVTDVRVQRLNDISEEDAIAEGVTKVRDHCYVIRGFGYDPIGLCHTHAVTPFALLWRDLNGPDSWDANPWVAAVTFTVHKCNVDAMSRELEPAE